MQYRPANDPQIWSHVFFVPGLMLSFFRNWELFIILSLVFVLSVANHVNYERPGLLSLVEGLAAKTLYLYGVCQMLRSPSWSTFFASFVCFYITSFIFLYSNYKNWYETDPEKWGYYHVIGLHLSPGIWIVITAIYYKPFLK